MSIEECWNWIKEILRFGRILETPDAEVSYAIRTEWQNTDAAVFGFATVGMDREGYDARIAEIVALAKKIEPKSPKRLNEEYRADNWQMAVIDDCVWVHEPLMPWHLDIPMSETLWSAQEGTGMLFVDRKA